jgi:hypothetical protein
VENVWDEGKLMRHTPAVTESPSGITRTAARAGARAAERASSEAVNLMTGRVVDL